MDFNEVGRKWLLVRAALALALAWGLIYADYRVGETTSWLRAEIAALALRPVRFVARLPTEAWSTTSGYFQSREELLVAKRELEEELLRQKARQQLADDIERENAILRRLVNARLRHQPDAVIAEIVNTASLPFLNRIVIGKGGNEGLAVGQGLFTDEGVIGQLTRVDSDTSHALLLTDKRFWVATRRKRDGTLVLLQGDGGGRMRLRFVPADIELRPGDVLETADGQLSFPGGIPVATVGETWQPEGVPFQEGEAWPVASVRQEIAVLVHASGGDVPPEALIPVEPSGAVPSSLKVEVLP